MEGRIEANDPLTEAITHCSSHGVDLTQFRYELIRGVQGAGRLEGVRRVSVKMMVVNQSPVKPIFEEVTRFASILWGKLRSSLVIGGVGEGDARTASSGIVNRAA